MFNDDKVSLVRQGNDNDFTLPPSLRHMRNARVYAPPIPYGIHVCIQLHNSKRNEKTVTKNQRILSRSLDEHLNTNPIVAVTLIHTTVR